MITSNPILFTIMCVLGIQAMVLSGLIAFKKPRRLANTFLALLIFFYALMVVNIVVVNVLNDQGLLHVFRYIQMEMLFGIGPALYFYTKCVTNPKFTFQKKHYWHFLPLFLEFIFYRTAIYRTGSDGLYVEEWPVETYIYLTQQRVGVISILVYGIISLSLLYQFQKQLKQFYSKFEHLAIRWLQTPVFIFSGYHIIWEIITETDRFFFR